MSDTEIPQNPQGEASEDSQRGAYKEHLKQPFLDAFRRLGTICEAAEAVGLHRDTISDWRQSDPVFSREFTSANTDVTDRFESALVQRAVHGIDRPIFYQGQQISTQKEYSDSLLMFLLRARCPERFNEHYRPDKNALERAFVVDIISRVANIVKKSVPDNCPSCKTFLNFKNMIAAEFSKVSEQP